jgi:anti-anti-sigma factor
LHLGGELDAATAPQLRTWLDGEARDDAICTVDLSELTFVDLAGVRTLATAISVLDERGIVSVVGMRGIVRRLAGLLGIDEGWWWVEGEAGDADRRHGDGSAVG